MRYGYINKYKLIEEIKKRSYSPKSLSLIIEFPEVDAVPVSFIRRCIRMAEGRDQEVLVNMLAEWREQ